MPLSARMGIKVLQLSVSVFAKANSLYVMIYKRNDSLRISKAPSMMFFNSIELHKQKVNIKIYWAAAMWLAWWRSSRTKPCLTIHHLRVFEKVLHLVLPQLMNYCERQWSQFVQVSGLQKLTQKIGLCLQLEMVDVCLHFRLNCITTYVKCVSAQLFVNWALNTIP